MMTWRSSSLMVNKLVLLLPLLLLLLVPLWLDVHSALLALLPAPKYAP
jgi:hypothetical protein